MTNAIEIRNLVKCYGKIKAVDHLSINVPEGKIYGFLGKNGAGKTTTIRMLMGLIKPDGGEIRIFGRDISKDRLWALKKMGAIVETPGFYENLSAGGNLEITADLYKIQKKRIDEVLEIVGLTDAKRRKVKEFSLGMKQRLGIANALIHSPDILILDEPANGLDPAGIKDIRLMLRNMADNGGITVLVSSHILSEIQLMADHVGIIDRGRLMAEDEISSIVKRGQKHLILEVDKMSEATVILDEMRLEYAVENEYQIKVQCAREMNYRINKNLVKGNVSVHSLASQSLNLEDIFLEMTEKKSACNI